MTSAQQTPGALPAPGQLIEQARLGRSSVWVTRLELGCAPIGGLYAPVREDDALETLQAAWESGIRGYDTAPVYGAGLSERRLGAFLRTQPREAFTLTTKVGRLLVQGAGQSARTARRRPSRRSATLLPMVSAALWRRASHGWAWIAWT